MTTIRSTAVVAGVMPDFGVPAGIMLCRTGVYTTANDNTVSGDTLEMVPIPANARILDMKFYTNGTAVVAGGTGLEIGDGSSNARFFNTISIEGAGGAAHTKGLLADGVAGGLGYDYSAQDTIDIFFKKAATKIPTGYTFELHVFYKMLGSISDEV